MSVSIVCCHACMQGVDALLMEQAGREMKEYYRGQESVLRDQFTWMRVFLKRTKTIDDEEKQKIEEVLDMLGLEQLWDESPLVQAERARAEAKGSLKTSRSLVEALVNVRFPALTNLAHQKVASMTQPEDLRTLLTQIGVVPNEAAAREFLLPRQSS
jgi:hypothetical protein